MFKQLLLISYGKKVKISAMSECPGSKIAKLFLCKDERRLLKIA